MAYITNTYAKKEVLNETNTNTYAKKEVLNETNTNGFLKFICPYSQNIVFSLANSNVTNVRIPKNLLNIDGSSFMNCQKLSAITVDEDNPKYDSRYDCNAIIETEENKLIFVCKNGTVPSDVAAIGPYAFNGFESIEVGENVQEIDPLAFYYCESLSSLTVDFYNRNYSSYGNIIFNEETGGVVAWGNNITIPGTMGMINNNAFSVSYYISEEDRSITRPNNIKNVVIESGITSIGYTAFQGQPITSITIPSSVANINDGAFNFDGYILKSNFINNSSLDAESNGYWGAKVVDSMDDGLVISGSTLVKYIGNSNSVTIPNSVTSIGNNAFNGCSSLTSVTIPNSVTSIGNYVFSDCTSLTSITIPDSVTTIGSSVFTNCSGVTSVTIGNGVTNIGDSAFGGCSSLTSVTIPDSVTDIGASAFRDCSSLTSVTIPDSVTDIGASAFSGCTNLITTTIGSGVTSIGSYAFSGCGGTLYYNNSNGPFVAYYDRAIRFDGFHTIIVGDGVTNICASAFTNCTSITSVTIPNTVTDVGENAFSGCSNLPCENNVIYADKWAIGVNDGTLQTYTLRANTVGLSNAFRDCRNLTGVTIPSGVISIGSNTFRGCSNLTGITIPDSVTTIGSYAFNSCSKLTSISIPDNVTTISNYAFSSCSGATSVTIGSGVTSIGDCAFNGCSNLTGITIPDSVTNIDGSAFNNCRSLTSVTIGSGVTSISSDAFAFCDAIKTIFIDAVGVDYRYFSDKNSITSVTLGEHCQYIYGNAFSGCTKTKEFTIGSNVIRLDNNALPGTCPIYVSPSVIMSYRTNFYTYADRFTPISYEGLMTRWVDVNEVCCNGELHMRQNMEISDDNGTNWYKTGGYRVDSTVLDQCASPVSGDQVVWLDGRTLDINARSWSCDDYADLLNPGWGVYFHEYDTTATVTNCLNVYGNRGGAQVQTNSSTFFYTPPNPLAGIINNSSASITYELVFSLDSGYTLANSYMSLLGGTYGGNGSIYNRWQVRVNSNGYPSLYNIYGSKTIISANTNIKDGKNHYFVLMKDTNNKWEMYLDAVKIAEASSSFGLPVGSGYEQSNCIGIGRYDGLHVTNTYSAVGRYYAFSIYARNLTASEIQVNYQKYFEIYGLTNS